ncbi:MAG: PilN domain-containing protein [Magnetococcales bacterium]|nr:PilN domain-containing protein [Magnetococcales bacterium]
MRIQINLLPYRPARRLAKVNQLFMIWGAVAFLGICAAFWTHSSIEDHIASLNAQKAEQEVLLKKLDAQLGEIADIKAKKERVKQRLELIATLSISRDLTLRILGFLSEAIPEKVWLNKVTTTQNKLELMGKAQSNSLVADFMRTLSTSPLLANVDLTRVARQSKEEKDMKEFTITATIRLPEPDPITSKTNQPKGTKR